MRRSRLSLGLTVWILLFSAAGCEREPETLAASQSVAPIPSTRLVDLQPGEHLPTHNQLPAYSESETAIREGQRLYGWFNCSGCHFAGGGGIGPPLMDDQWIYGNAPANIRSAIIEGRPNGMPSYGGKIPESELLHLVAYVRSLSGLTEQENTRK